MDRTNGAGHVNHFFAAENLATGRPPTEITTEWLNGVQEEIVNVIEAGGIAPNQAVSNQLLIALRSAGVFSSPAQFDDSTRAATTAWANDRGLAYSSLNGHPLSVSCAIDPAWLGSWGEVEAANLTFTLPRAASVLVGAAFTFKTAFDCVIAGMPAAGALPADTIVSPSQSGASFNLAAGEAVTLVSNGIGNAWYIVNIGHSLATSDARYAPKSILTKLARLVVDVEDFGAIGDGVANDAPAFQAAMSAVGVLGGGQVRAAKRYLIDQALSIPNNVHLVGVMSSPGEIFPLATVNYAAISSVLTINPAVTITTGDGSSVSGFYVLNKGISLPFADATAAVAGLAAFSGTAFTVGGFDTKFANLLVLGFNQLIYSLSKSRIVCDRVYGDNNNGIYIEACWDIARIDNCHQWPFTTVHRSWTTNVLLRRPGIAYEFINGGDWNKATDSFSYGYYRGTAIRSCNNVMVTGGGADNTSTGGIGDHPGSLGLLVDGGSRQTNVLGFTTAAQSQGFYINTPAGYPTQIRGCDAHGISGSGIYVGGGDVVVAGNFVRNAANAVTVTNALSNVDIDHNQFDVISGVVVNTSVAMTNVRIGDHNQYGNLPVNSQMVQNINATPSIATASTLQLPLRGTTFNLTGSVSFGSMAGQWPEREVMLIASAAVTALHSLGANGLCLKAKASLVMAVNDVLVLRHNGFQWYQI